eukprot:Skav218987  [mRNA]  locus=scaffold169:52316:52528:+ [translate_table: standard]
MKLPSCLRSLTFGRRFNQSLAGVTWPDNLVSLDFGRNFSHEELKNVNLPSGLQSLVLEGVWTSRTIDSKK